jgi:ABC-type uncharacterized transport system permease subunit
MMVYNNVKLSASVLGTTGFGHHSTGDRQTIFGQQWTSQRHAGCRGRRGQRPGRAFFVCNQVLMDHRWAKSIVITIPIRMTGLVISHCATGRCSNIGLGGALLIGSLGEVARKSTADLSPDPY